jgi:16S rRNA (uracil1498-N3)-methyltransferase
MTRRRWIADEVSGNHAALTGDHADHLIRVLRARLGQEFEISTGASIRLGRVTAINGRRVEFDLADELPAAPAPRITLALSIFKFDRMEWAIEKCTELGVTRIIPLIARRTDPHLASAAAKRVERWRRIAAQAAEQSRRDSAPELDAPRKLKALLTLPDVRIVLSEAEQDRALKDAIGAVPASQANLALAIGPEGGWTDEELNSFAQSGWISASLGTTILRVETAAIAATAIAISELASSPNPQPAK